MHKPKKGDRVLVEMSVVTVADDIGVTTLAPLLKSGKESSLEKVYVFSSYIVKNLTAESEIRVGDTVEYVNPLFSSTYVVLAVDESVIFIRDVEKRFVAKAVDVSTLRKVNNAQD